MKTFFVSLALSMFYIVNVWAAPAPAPENATAQCKDGSYYSGANKRGACSRHGGIQTWYGNEVAKPLSSQTAPAQLPSGPPDQAPVVPSRERTAQAPISNGTNAQVWVNTESKVYHCPNTHWYGITKQGQYMSESQARAQGYKPDHNKSCGM